MLVLTLALLAGACSSEDGEAASGSTAPSPLNGTEGSVTAFTLEPGPNSPISGVLTVEADTPTRARVTARSPDHVVELPATADLQDRHEIPVVGLRADRTYNVVAELSDDDGDVVGAGGDDLTTGPLPAAVADYEVIEADPERMAPGLTLLDVGSWGAGSSGDRPELLAIDDEGEVVWYFQDEDVLIGDTRLTEEGTIVMQYGLTGLREVDLLGRTLADYRIGPTDLPPDEAPIEVRSDEIELRSMHHSADRLDNGNYLTVSRRILELTPDDRAGFCAEDVSEWAIQDDVIVEFTPDGEVVDLWSLADAVDPRAVPGTDLCLADDFGTDRDWAHVNAAEVDLDRNAIIFSARHLDTIGALRYEDDDRGPAGELLWAIGPEGVGTIPLDGDPAYHAHGPEIGEDGSILVYDNGNGRVEADGQQSAPPYSRVVRYEVDDSSDDPADWRATEVWSHVDEDETGAPIYADFLGDADEQANGNVIAHHGGIGQGADVRLGRIIELDPDGEVVFHLRLEDYKVSYRSERIPSLYAGPRWQTD